MMRPSLGAAICAATVALSAASPAAAEGEAVWLSRQQVQADGGRLLSASELESLLVGKTCSVQRRKGDNLRAVFTDEGMVLHDKGFTPYRITTEGEVCYTGRSGRANCQTVLQTRTGYRVFDADGTQRSIVTCGT